MLVCRPSPCPSHRLLLTASSSAESVQLLLNCHCQGLGRNCTRKKYKVGRSVGRASNIELYQETLSFFQHMRLLMRRVVGPLRVHHLSGDTLEPCHHASRNPQGPLRTAANLRSKHGSHSRAISCHILPSTK